MCFLVRTWAAVLQRANSTAMASRTMRTALEPTFLNGIDRVISGANEHTIALMCSEHNPLDCHRCLLVGRALSERHVPVGHILNNGRVAEQPEIEDKLLRLAGG